MRGIVHAVQVYPWNEGAVYRLDASPERVTDIVLQAGETLVSVAAGDTARWTIGDRDEARKLPDRVPIKITISVTAELNQAFGKYAAAYHATYGAAEPALELTPAMLTSFLDSDRAFASQRRAR